MDFISGRAVARILGATNKQLEDRVKALEAMVAALIATPSGDHTTPCTRLTTLENKTCPQQTVLDDLDARLDVLDADHIPT